MTGSKMPGFFSHLVISSRLAVCTSTHKWQQQWETSSENQQSFYKKVGRGVTSFANSATPGADTLSPEIVAQASPYWKTSE